MEGVENPNSNKGAESKTFKILDESLVGKTEAELTPEEREAENQFCKEKLEVFLDLIDKEKIMVHGAKTNLSSIFDQGIASYFQRFERNIAGNEGHRRGEIDWQGFNFQFLFKKVIRPYAQSYRYYLEGNLTKEGLDFVKNDILEKIPAIGKKRVLYFMDKVIPNFVKENLAIPEDRNIRSGDEAYSPKVKEKEISAFKIDKKRYPNLTKEENDQALWQRLANIIGGTDMVSSTPASYLKRDFADEGDLSSGYGNNSYSIYFDTPPDERMYNLTTVVMPEMIDYDVGVSNRITPNHFRAFRGGTYDKEKRIFYLTPEIQLEDIVTLYNKQKEGLIILDGNLMPLPPLGSVQVSRAGIKHNSTLEHDDYDLSQMEELKAMDKIDTDNWEQSINLITTVAGEKGYDWGNKKT